MTSGLGHSKHRGLLVLRLNMGLNCKCAFSGAFQRVRTRRFHLGVSVLAGLWGRHVNYLTRTAFEHDIAVLPQRRALLGVRLRGPGSTTIKFVHDGLEGGNKIDRVSKKREQINPINVFIPLKHTHTHTNKHILSAGVLLHSRMGEVLPAMLLWNI